MKNRKAEGLVIIFCGLVIAGAGLYIYFFANTVYPNSGSSRVQNLNWLLNTFGKTGTTVLFTAIGLLVMMVGLRRMRK